jgi:hypothetical protein
LTCAAVAGLHGPLYRHGSASVLALFRRAGYISDGVARPVASLTVYRGEPTDNGQPGIAWTTDREVAVKYARDYSTIGDVQVRQATVPPGSVLARFTFESEVVVDPALLADTRVIGRMPHFKLTMRL